MKDFLLKIRSLWEGSGADKAQQALRDVGGAAKKGEGALISMGPRGATALWAIVTAAQAAWAGITAGLSIIGQFFGSAMKAAGGAQTLQVSFAALLGDGEKAAALLTSPSPDPLRNRLLIPAALRLSGPEARPAV